MQLVTYGAREFEVAERVKPLDNAFNGLFEVESGMDAANKVMIFDTLMDCSSLFLTGNTDTASRRNGGAHVRMGVGIQDIYLS